jgi:hypothetical protein
MSDNELAARVATLEKQVTELLSRVRSLEQAEEVRRELEAGDDY